VLAAGELAIALMLLVGAGLLIRSFIALNNQDPGFATNGVLTLRLQLPAAKYNEPARIVNFYEQLTERLAALPGVESAGVGTSLLLSRLPNSAAINIEGRPAPPPDAPNIPVPYDSVSPQFFSTLKIPLRLGRLFTPADSPESQQVAIVNEAFVRRFFHGQDPLGRGVTFDDPRPDARWQTIVGVVADTKRGGFEREPWAEVYFPMRQAPDSRAFVLLRTGGDPSSLVGAVQAAVWSIDRDQAIGAIRTVRELFAEQEANRRFTTLLLGVFAALALTLAIIGIYGVISYSTAQRTQEIGIRMALGADKSAVGRMVLASGLRIAVVGLTVGVLGALALTRLLSGLLFGVGARDPATFVVVPATLLLVSLAGCWIPARRAMRVDPVIALRGEN
jgi:putative ABC transport system permease protein